MAYDVGSCWWLHDQSSSRLPRPRGGISCLSSWALVPVDNTYRSPTPLLIFHAHFLRLHECTCRWLTPQFFFPPVIAFVTSLGPACSYFYPCFCCQVGWLILLLVILSSDDDPPTLSALVLGLMHYMQYLSQTRQAMCAMKHAAEGELWMTLQEN